MTSQSAPNAPGGLTDTELQQRLDDALAELDEFRAEREHREAARRLLPTVLNSEAPIDDPIEMCEQFARVNPVLLQGSLAYADGFKPSVWVWISPNPFSIEPGLVVGDDDTETMRHVLTEAEAKPEQVLTTIATPAGRNFCVMRVASSVPGLGWWAVVATEIPSGYEIDQTTSAILLVTAGQSAINMDRISRVFAARIEAQHALAAARVLQRLAEPLPRDDALRIAVEELRKCEDITEIAAVGLGPSGAFCVDQYGDITRGEVETLVTGDLSDDQNSIVMPIDVDGQTDGYLIVRSTLDPSVTSKQTLAGSATAVASSIARRRSAELLSTLSRTTTRRLVEAQERERAMVAADIHDGVLQQLGATAMRLELACTRLDENDAHSAREIMISTIEQLRKSTVEVREMLMALRPQALHDIGLRAAIAELGNHTEGVEVKIESDVPEHLLSNELTTTVFRIVQEALNNVRKHARAQNAAVTLSSRGESLVVEIVDDGDGLPDRPVPRGSVGQQLGIHGMRERAAMLGGTFEVTSSRGKGTKVRVELQSPHLTGQAEDDPIRLT